MLPVARRHLASCIPSWLATSAVAGGSQLLSQFPEAQTSHNNSDAYQQPLDSCWNASHAEHSKHLRQRHHFHFRSFASQPEQPQGTGSSHQGAEASQEQPLPTQDVEYLGPLSKTHTLLKRISIANTSLALAAAPAIVMYADASFATRIGLAISLAMFGVMTTGALHWITNPYVHELKYNARNQELDVKTTSLLGTPRWSHFSISDVHPLPWNRPVATFVAKNKYYYIDVYSFPEENLLKRLTPQDVPEGYKEDKDDD